MTEQGVVSPTGTCKSFDASAECHGTGTPIGDPLETQAVARVFGENGVLIGSVKPNMGHSEGASGLTSMFKMLIAMEKKAIPPNMHFKIPNPKIPFKDAKLSVPVEVSPWPVGREERVSVNSFGIGGSNAHVVLDSAASWNVGNKTSLLEQSTSSSPELLVFSANHPESLKRLTKNYASYIQTKSPVLSDLAYTLALRRNHMQYRSICVGGFEELTFTPPVRIGGLPTLLFVFTGQGAQWAGMGKELLINYPSFRKDIGALNKTLAQCAHPPSWNLEDELLKPKETSLINSPELSQPLCVAIQIALVNLLKLWNIEPQGVVGHSSGEIAAAYTSGIITADEAIIIAYYRGYVMKSQKLNGGMAAIGLGHHEVSPYLVPGVLIACENSPDSVTISGDADKLEQVMAAVQLANPDKLVRRLRVDMAYHSRM
ncbi:putative Lovastatin nonaketide synthase [Glarea lozoyensis 74030]|uniref:Putative Lovastatin nonaketide synthase n=1 Tax=Glarea lozoyensis (strain ATCC 74030 / MF5533) TaxID=1104152 RepID=H0ESY9_GLAL7|nr:putative Lovastatin nonaketide synthase [Glarea lozoyensis 74030]